MAINASSAPLGKKKQLCLTGFAGQIRAIVKTQLKDVISCIANAEKSGNDPRICSLQDVKGKVAKAVAKALEKEAKQCKSVPGFGHPSPTQAIEAAENASRTLALSRTTLAPLFDLEISRICEKKALGALSKYLDGRLKEYEKCIKAGLKKGIGSSGVPIRQANCDDPDDAACTEGLAGCLFRAMTTAPFYDPKGKHQKAIDKLQATIVKACPDPRSLVLDWERLEAWEACIGAPHGTLGCPGTSWSLQTEAEWTANAWREEAICTACELISTVSGISSFDCTYQPAFYSWNEPFDPLLLAGVGPTCGDGVKEGGELCDDGNDSDADSCSSDCIPTTCGDGVWGESEDCDPNASAVCGDGRWMLYNGEACEADWHGEACCSETCEATCSNPDCWDASLCDYTEDPATPWPIPSCPDDCNLAERCGDGDLDPNEECDDGNIVSGDGCDGNCTLPSCGNALATAGEECDGYTGLCDGGIRDGRLCSQHSDCLGGVCSSCWGACQDDCTCGNAPRTLIGAVCEPACGDGRVSFPEQCDDGNFIDGDGCDSNCTPSVCGNTIVTTGEKCDGDQAACLGGERDGEWCRHDDQCPGGACDICEFRCRGLGVCLSGAPGVVGEGCRTDADCGRAVAVGFFSTPIAGSGRCSACADACQDDCRCRAEAELVSISAPSLSVLSLPESDCVVVNVSTELQAEGPSSSASVELHVSGETTPLGMWPASSDAGIDLPEGAHSTVWAVCTDSLAAGDCMDLQATASLEGVTVTSEVSEICVTSLPDRPLPPSDRNFLYDDEGLPFALDDVVQVKFDTNVTSSKIEEFAVAIDGTIAGGSFAQRTYQIEFDEAFATVEDLKDFLDILREDTAVLLAEPLSFAQRDSSAPDRSAATGAAVMATTPWGIADAAARPRIEMIRADEAWYLASGRGQGVIVIDDGVDSANPFLASAMRGFTWNRMPCTGISRSGPCYPGLLAWQDISDAYSKDEHANAAQGAAHGTKVAGFIVSESEGLNTSSGRIAAGAGIAPDASVMSINDTYGLLSDASYVAEATLQNSLLMAMPATRAEAGPKVVNLSQTGLFETLSADVCGSASTLAAAGVSFVAAAGNSAGDTVGYYPAACGEVIGVGGVQGAGGGEITQNNQALAAFGNVSSAVEVVAPAYFRENFLTPICGTYAGAGKALHPDRCQGPRTSEAHGEICNADQSPSSCGMRCVGNGIVKNELCGSSLRSQLCTDAGGSYDAVNDQCSVAIPAAVPCGTGATCQAISCYRHCAQLGYKTDEFAGTSFAAPQVAGAIALLRELDPELEPQEIRERLTSTSAELPTSLGFPAGVGLLDVFEALSNGGFEWDRDSPGGVPTHWNTTWDGSVVMDKPPFYSGAPDQDPWCYPTPNRSLATVRETFGSTQPQQSLPLDRSKVFAVITNGRKQNDPPWDLNSAEVGGHCPPAFHQGFLVREFEIKNVPSDGRLTVTWDWKLARESDPTVVDPACEIDPYDPANPYRDECNVNVYNKSPLTMGVVRYNGSSPQFTGSEGTVDESGLPILWTMQIPSSDPPLAPVSQDAVILDDLIDSSCGTVDLANSDFPAKCSYDWTNGYVDLANLQPGERIQFVALVPPTVTTRVNDRRGGVPARQEKTHDYALMIDNLRFR